MMKGVETILKRPGRPLRTREDARFLLILLENPLLSQSSFPQETQYHHSLLKRSWA